MDKGGAPDDTKKYKKTKTTTTQLVVGTWF